MKPLKGNYKILLILLIILQSCNSKYKGKGEIELENGLGDLVSVQYDTRSSEIEGKLFLKMVKSANTECKNTLTNKATYVPKKIQIGVGDLKSVSTLKGEYYIIFIYVGKNGYGVDGLLESILTFDKKGEFLEFVMTKEK